MDYLLIATIYFEKGNLEDALLWIGKGLTNKEGLISSYELENLQEVKLVPQAHNQTHGRLRSSSHAY